MEQAATKTKVCAKCRSEKPMDCFTTGNLKKGSGNKDGKHSYCKPCLSALAKQWRLKNPERAKDVHRRVIFGLPLGSFASMKERQNGRCAICNRIPKDKRGLSIDHDHQTGKVRELLCPQCNYGLGNFGDNVENMRRAIKYLIKHRNTQKDIAQDFANLFSSAN